MEDEVYFLGNFIYYSIFIYGNITPLFSRHHWLMRRSEIVGSTEVTPEEIDAEAKFIAERYLANAANIREQATIHGAEFIVASQMAKSGLIERSQISGVSYAEEAERIRAKLMSEESISPLERRYLYHAQIIRDQKKWARENNIPFVDIIDTLDQRRDGRSCQLGTPDSRGQSPHRIGTGQRNRKTPMPMIPRLEQNKPIYL